MLFESKQTPYRPQPIDDRSGSASYRLPWVFEVPIKIGWLIYGVVSWVRELRGVAKKMELKW